MVHFYLWLALAVFLGDALYDLTVWFWRKHHNPPVVLRFTIPPGTDPEATTRMIRQNIERYKAIRR